MEYINLAIITKSALNPLKSFHFFVNSPFSSFCGFFGAPHRCFHLPRAAPACLAALPSPAAVDHRRPAGDLLPAPVAVGRGGPTGGVADGTWLGKSWKQCFLKKKKKNKIRDVMWMLCGCYMEDGFWYHPIMIYVTSIKQ